MNVHGISGREPCDVINNIQEYITDVCDIVAIVISHDGRLDVHMNAVGLHDLAIMSKLLEQILSRKIDEATL